MSRFTASPFHRPSPFVQGQQPPSPPDTYSDPSATHHPISHSAGLGMQDYVPSDEPTISPETSTPRSKKASLPYHLSGFREKERTSTPRNPKCLVIVMPPSTLFKDQEDMLAGTVHHRLLQGVVLPLFPSMYAQVTAIAREFNFPSTSGLSLYFHHLEGGIAFAPRVSEEAWPIIWSHISDPTVAHERRGLFSGRLEFDIDLRLARWYSAWLTSLLRDTAESIYVHPSTAPSVHQRHESRSTMVDSRFEDSVVQESAAIVQRSAPVNGRHVPRKLSLVERFDLTSTKNEARGPSNLKQDTQDSLASSSALATIKQEDEPPRTAREVLNDRVATWRQSAIPVRSPLTAKGQVSLDPSNIPNNVEVDLIVPTTGSEEEGEEELRLEDFEWDASSAGPLSPLESLLSWGRVPSVHLATRLEGSVCTTPSVCTSFGPLDYDPLSPVLSHYRLPSPDVAHRMLESAPLTPLTATSWGAPSWPPSPRCVSPTPSLDIGERTMFPELAHLRPLERSLLLSPAESRNVPPAREIQSTVYPVTQIYPDANTPWELVWPYTESFIDERKGDAWPLVWPYTEEFIQENKSKPWPMVWPYTEDFISEHKGKPWELVWPYVEQFIQGHKNDGWKFVWPYTEEFVQTVHKDETWKYVWPYTSSFMNTSADKEKSWQFVWPYTSRFFAASASGTEPVTEGSPQPSGSVYPSVELEAAYPNLVIYPAVYPHNLTSMYPQSVVSRQSPGTQRRAVSMEGCSYPVFDIYPAVYPHFDLYPEVARAERPQKPRAAPRCLSMTLESAYPYFNLYPAVYPNLEIYPACHGKTEAEHSAPRAVNVTLDASYPAFNLYPAVYPHFDIYPSAQVQATSLPVARRKPIETTLEPSYPSFNLYPPVYPHFDIYPSAISTQVKSDAQLPRNAIKIAIEPCYPSFDIYPAGYPHFDIYPSTKVAKADEGSRKITVTLASAYPVIELYPPVYPHLEIYPAVPSARGTHDVTLKRLPPVSVEIEPHYPYFNLYPAVYPHIEIYPKPGPTIGFRQRCVYKPSRLTHSELHAMVMMERALAGNFGSFDGREPTRELTPPPRPPPPTVPLPPIPTSVSSLRPSRGRAGSIARPMSGLPSNPRPQSSFLASARVDPDPVSNRFLAASNALARSGGPGLPPSRRPSLKMPSLDDVDEWPAPPPLPQGLTGMLPSTRNPETSPSPVQLRKTPSFLRQSPAHRTTDSSSPSRGLMGRRDSLVMQLAKSYEASVSMATSS